jgi:hypothetical protein
MQLYDNSLSDDEQIMISDILTGKDATTSYALENLPKENIF